MRYCADTAKWQKKTTLKKFIWDKRLAMGLYRDGNGDDVITEWIARRVVS